VKTIHHESKPKGSGKAAQANQNRSPRLSSAEVAEVLDNTEPSAERIASLLSRAEFARRLNVCSHTIQRMERRGLIHGLRFNARLIRYPVSELDRLLKEASV